MDKIAIIGAGISGLSAAQLLSEHADITIFEKDSQSGGLIKCIRVEDNLYHIVGGHVFNSKNKKVLDWFWSFFNKEEDFTSTIRNTVINLLNFVKYPIENNIYQLSEDQVKNILKDLLSISKIPSETFENFEEFLLKRFGKTLYELYFKPYNEKIWKQDLNKIPLSWLEGKLPMPTVEDILLNNIFRKEEKEMVHSSFFYPKINGSQFIADRLSEELNIKYNTPISSIRYIADTRSWIIDNEKFDFIIYTGNIKDLKTKIDTQLNLKNIFNAISDLEFHGTTSVLCKIDPNPYSWIYLPNKNCDAHRIICTGNFSATNNSQGITTATVEFTDHVDKNKIVDNLKLLPFSPQYITHRYTEYTYPIQSVDTRKVIDSFKRKLESQQFFLLGRFAEWEYYNMDTAIGAAMSLSEKIINLIKGNS